MKKYQINCPYCKSPARLRPASVVHGSSVRSRRSYLYICSHWPECDAYVSAHKKNCRPMGTLANGSLRHKRILAHRALKELQASRNMEKWAAYLWLQGKLSLPESQTHIGLFSEQMCEQVIALCYQHCRSVKQPAA